MRLIPRKRGLGAALLLALILVFCIACWHLFYPVALDHAFFRLVNGSLADKPWLQHLFAFANTRRFDLIGGIVMGIFFVVPGLVFSKGRRRYGIFGFGLAFILFQPFRSLLAELSGYRYSPGRIYHDDMIRLDKLDPMAKVGSDWSFPSDHTAVLLMWACYLCVAGNSRLRWLSWIVVILLSSPRLVGGGHWLSDVILGSPMVALPPLILLFLLDLTDLLASKIPARFHSQAQKDQE